jgi:protein-arginine kinase activator protein McsA
MTAAHESKNTTNYKVHRYVILAITQCHSSTLNYNYMASLVLKIGLCWHQTFEQNIVGICSEVEGGNKQHDDTMNPLFPLLRAESRITAMKRRVRKGLKQERQVTILPELTF